MMDEDDDGLPPDVLHLIDSGASHSISSTLRALHKARLWCEPVATVLDEFVARPLLPYDERRLVFGRLREEELSADDVARLRSVVDALEEAGLRPGRSHGSVFSTIGDILALLDRSDRVPRCLRYLSLRKWQPRAMASRLLRNEDLTVSEASEVVAAISVMPQKLTMELAARNAQRLTVHECLEVVLPLLDSEYWQSRIIERLLARDEVALEELAERWPMATLWAIARNRWPDRLPGLLGHLPALEANWRLLPIVTWALGRLGASGELDALENALRARPEMATYARLNGL